MSSIVVFFSEVSVKLFDYFRKPNSLFSRFCVICLLMFYFVYCTNCALKDVHGACYCTCSLVALRVPEMCFWPAKTRKNLELFEMHTYLWPGAQIVFRLKWRKLVTASLLLHCIDWYSCFRFWKEFFFSCVSDFRLKYSRIALWRKRLQLDSKSDLTLNGLVLWFSNAKWFPSLTSYLYGLKSARIDELLLFLTTSIFFDV